MRLGSALLRARSACAAGALALLCATALPAAAQQAAGGASPPRPDAESQRTVLYREGAEAAKAGRWAEARERFAAVLAIRGSPKAFFSLAQVEEQLGQVASAEADYVRARESAQAAGEADVVAAAEQARSAIAPRVPHVRVLVTGSKAATATATLDDRPIALSVPVALDPGPSRHLVVSAPDTPSWETRLPIGESVQLDVPVRLGPEPAAVAPPEPSHATAPAPARAESPAAAQGPWRTVGLLAAGAGVMALGAGAYFGLQAQSKKSDSEKAGCRGDMCTATAAPIRREALNDASASTAMFITGGVLAAGGLLVYFFQPSPNQAVGLAPLALERGAGLRVSGRW